jgi:PAS domain S-box-containing protein
VTEDVAQGSADLLAEKDELTARLGHQLSLAQQITHIGSWEWNPGTNVLTWSHELYRIYGLEPGSIEVSFAAFLAMLHPEDRARVQAEVSAALERGGRFAWLERIVRPDGSVRDLDTVGEVARGADGKVLGMIGTCRDITREVLAHKLRAAETRILELIATGAPLAEILEVLVLAIEEQAPATLGSILLLDGVTVRHGAAPSLPAEYNRSITGRPIGPRAGSCGTAAYLRRPVFVSDIETDPLWADYREFARPYGLRACWSTPILASDGRVLGTFALYYNEPRAPDDATLALIARATHLAGIAIERTLVDEQLRALSGRIEAVREDERTAMAREIHDELGQALTALKMDVAWVLRRNEEVPLSAPVVNKLKAMSGMTDRIIDQVRRISTELRPGVLDDLGLVAAIEWLTQEFEGRTGTTSVFASNVRDARFERNLSTAIFRILQEALTNVARHAEASRVEVRLGQEDAHLCLEVKDDGRGISQEAISDTKSLGLLGMRERARRLGGTVTVSGSRDLGTRITVEVPLVSAGAAP